VVIDAILGGLNSILNGIIDVMSTIADGIVWLLPKSPFAALELAFDGELLGYMNYFLPISEMLNIMVSWGIAIAAFYLYKIILRWVKALR
jgi:hypothetical protein